MRTMGNKSSLSRPFKVALLIAGVFVAIAGIFLIAIFSTVFADVNRSVKQQSERLEGLKAMYSEGGFTRVNEQNFCDFDLNLALQNDLKLIDLQFLGTHNSYKKEKSALEKMFAAFSKDLRQGNYAFETPTDQLNAGIRSFEFDLFCRQRKNGVTFHSFHIGYADMSSNAFDFKTCLEEINLWSVNNPNHLPITIILELKEKGGAYPYSTIERQHLADLDKLIKAEMSTLYTPAQAFEGYDNLNEMRACWDSPSLKETMGKVLFILHPTKLMQDYISLDTSFCTQAMFPAAYFWWDKAVGLNSFVIINNHGAAEGSIDENGGRKNGYLFRIMLEDSINGNAMSQQIESAIATGATICSTNLPPLLKPKDGYISVSFAENGKTVRLVSDSDSN